MCVHLPPPPVSSMFFLLAESDLRLRVKTLFKLIMGLSDLKSHNNYTRKCLDIKMITSEITPLPIHQPNPSSKTHIANIKQKTFKTRK